MAHDLPSDDSTRGSRPPSPPRPGRLVGVLALAAGLAAGLLAIVHALTRDTIAQRDEEARVESLAQIFFPARTGDGTLRMEVRRLQEAPPVFALVRPGESTPAYFAALGRGTGYNNGVPIEIMAGFTNPAHRDDARTLLDGYGVMPHQTPEAGARGFHVVGFRVVKSEETPGLGEKIKETRPDATWGQRLTGTAPRNAPVADPDTDFQRQFRGLVPRAMEANKNIDALTAATITTNGLIRALRDAVTTLERQVGATGRQDHLPPPRRPLSSDRVAPADATPPPKADATTEASPVQE